jgi:hypothetical protein
MPNFGDASVVILPRETPKLRAAVVGGPAMWVGED